MGAGNRLPRKGGVSVGWLIDCLRRYMSALLMRRELMRGVGVLLEELLDEKPHRASKDEG